MVRLPGFAAVIAFALLGSSAYAQSGRSELISERRLNEGGVQIAKHWRYRLGDNPSWALAAFDDSDWKEIDITKPLPPDLLKKAREMEAADKPAVMWLRTELQPERSLIRKPLALDFRAGAATNLYIDGRKILDLGDFGVVGREARVDRALLPTTIVFDSARSIMAIRYHIGTALAFATVTQPPFIATVKPNSAIATTAESRRFDGGLQLGIFGLFLAVGMMHFMLYLLLRKPVSNLHYSAFAGQFAFAMLCVYFGSAATSVRTVTMMNNVADLAATLAFVALLMFLYTSFYERVPRVSRIMFALAAIGALTCLAGVFQYFSPLINAVGTIAIAIVLLECVRVLALALYRRNEGARPVLAGFALSFLALIYILLGQIGVFPELPHANRVLLFSTLGLAFAPSMHLAYGFAQVSKNLEVRVKQRTAALENLLTTMQDLSGQLELAPVLRSVVERAVKLLGAAGGEFAIVDETTQELVVVANNQMKADTVGMRLKMSEGAMGYAIGRREQLVIPDYQKWQGRSTLYDAVISHAVVVSPLLIGDHPVGALAVWHEEKGKEFSKEELDLMNAFAQQAAVAVENARLYTATQEQRQYFEGVVTNSPVAIVTIDLDQNISAVNPAFERLFGWKGEEIIGQNLDALVTDEASRHEAVDMTSDALSLADQTSSLHRTGRRRRKDGGWLEVEVQAVPVVVNGQRRGLVAMYHDITELTRAKREAEAADSAKSQFLANMSHELRTPLNAVIGYSEMLMEEATDAGHEDYVPDLQKIHTSGRHLLGLINDILDLSKIEAGRMELYLESFDLSATMDEVANTIKPLIDKNSNRLDVQIPQDLGVVRLDQVKVRQILFNLLSNASKFTENGTITLAAARDGDRVQLTIADTGIGMTNEQMGKLFQPFTQADASTTKKYGGTGLGLAISRHFCEMMGGMIELDSDLNKGTTFTVNLPADAETVAATSHEDVVAEVAQHTGDASGTVLIIDDDPTAREMLTRMLMKEGYRVLSAPTGEDGIRMAKEERPDVITLDVLMAGLDGWGVLTRLKGDDATAAIPVIVVTVIDNRNLGYALGAADYLTKPIERERLADALKRVHVEPKSGPILVVDDDPMIREMLRRTLEKDGWGVVEAENGRVALDAMLEHTPAAVLLDLMMPEMDGFTFIDEIRHRGVAGLAPILVLTAKTLTPEDRQRLQGAVIRIMQKGEHSSAELLNEIRSSISQTKVSSHA